MFWIRAFLNLKVINIVLSLFYLHRGATLAEIFYLGLFWATGALLFEIPSSYLADKWGRKRTIILGAIFMSIYLFVFIFAQGFIWLAVAMVFYGLSFACFSGTDHALLYDTEKELRGEEKTLSRLGSYDSAQNIFKIFTPIIGALIAHDLSSIQFVIVIVIDFIGTLVALYLSFRIVEPNHHMDLEKQEAGIIMDAIKIFKTHKMLARVILNSELVFFASLIIFLYYQKIFVDLGLTIIFIGVGWGFSHLLRFLVKRNIHLLMPKISIYKRINILNHIAFAFLASFIVVWFSVKFAVLLFILYIIFSVTEGARKPLFAEIYNKYSHSYNRSTTLSLANFTHSILEFPIFIFAGILITKNIIFPIIFGLFLILFTLVFLTLKQPQGKLKRL